MLSLLCPSFFSLIFYILHIVTVTMDIVWNKCDDYDNHSRPSIWQRHWHGVSASGQPRRSHLDALQVAEGSKSDSDENADCTGPTPTSVSATTDTTDTCDRNRSRPDVALVPCGHTRFCAACAATVSPSPVWTNSSAMTERRTRDADAILRGWVTLGLNYRGYVSRQYLWTFR